jgi:hypothetical protein
MDNPSGIMTLNPAGFCIVKDDELDQLFVGAESGGY